MAGSKRRVLLSAARAPEASAVAGVLFDVEYGAAFGAICQGFDVADFNSRLVALLDSLAHKYAFRADDVFLHPVVEHHFCNDRGPCRVVYEFNNFPADGFALGCVIIRVLANCRAARTRRPYRATLSPFLRYQPFTHSNHNHSQ